MSKTQWLFLLLPLCLSCGRQSSTAPEAESKAAYFDIKTFFNQEAGRLQQLNLPVNKTVSVNGVTEEKKLKIENWEKEFSAFTDADLNKSAWKGSFKVTKQDHATLYTSSSDRIPVKELLVEQKNGTVTGIHLVMANKNVLYDSTDTLTYYPDSLYQLIKRQKIKLLEAKDYRITTRFK